MVWAAIVVGTVSAGVAIYNGYKSRKAAQGMADDAAGIAALERAALEKQKQEYRDMEFKNPYEGYENVYANVTNQYANLENTYEDLTVNQQQSQFEKQMFQQSQSNIMQQMGAAAGGSGIAALAQSMANAGSLQAQQASASIGMQEGQIKQLQAGEASRLQGMDAQARANVEMARLGGEDARQRALMSGAAQVQEMEASRQSTLLGMQYGAAAGANSALQAANLNQAQVDAASRQATTQAVGDLAGTVTKAGVDTGWTYKTG